MPTITLTIDEATLGALVRGEAVQLTATLRARKPRAKGAGKGAPTLTAEEAALHETVAALVSHHRPDVHVGRAWKAIKPLFGRYTRQQIEQALDIALDWTEGRRYEPEWFAKDIDVWLGRLADAQEDVMALEAARESWRATRAGGR